MVEIHQTYADASQGRYVGAYNASTNVILLQMRLEVRRDLSLTRFLGGNALAECPCDTLYTLGPPLRRSPYLGRAIGSSTSPFGRTSCLTGRDNA